MVKRFRGFSQLVQDGFKQEVRVKTPNGFKKMSALEIMVRKQVMGAVKGEKQALKFVLKYLAELPEMPGDPLIIERHFSDGSREIPGPRGTKKIDAQGNVTWHPRK